MERRRAPQRPDWGRPLVGHLQIAWLCWAATLALVIGHVPLLIAVDSWQSQMLGAEQPLVAVLANDLARELAFLAFATVGLLAVTRHSGSRMGWLSLAAGLVGIADGFSSSYAVYALLVSPGVLVGGLVAGWLQNWLWVVSMGLLGVFVPLLFPDGRPLSPGWRRVACLAGGVVAADSLVLAFLPGPLTNAFMGLPAIANPLGFNSPIFFEVVPGGMLLDLVLFGALLTLILVAVASSILRLRRARGDERQQMKWFVACLSGLASLFVAQAVARQITGDSSLLVAVLRVGLMLAAIGIPVALGLAILKYHLYDIDVIVNRALVYGTLTAGVVGLYVLVVGALGTQFQASGNVVVSLAATGLVAVLFQPVRERLQRTVNRLLYGERDEPYTVLSRLGRRLEEMLATDAVLPMIVETVARALKLPYVAVAMERNGGLEVAAAYGLSLGDLVRLPLVYRAETVGHLLLARRAPDEPFGSADHRLLNDLASQVGVAVHAARLTADLQRSRERLVTTREEERRRLRRDLHDGLGPALAAQTLKVGSARALYSHQPHAADALLAELETDMQTALSDVRRLVYDLRPPALDELGLIGAIREAAARYRPQPGDTNALSIGVEAPDSMPPLAAAVEVAAYRIVQEALTNVVRHAHARYASVRVSMDVLLRVEITDDGSGLPAPHHVGVGLVSMRERAEELGGTCLVELRSVGGTRVLACLPLPANGLRETIPLVAT